MGNVAFGTNVTCRKRRLYYTESSTIYEGMPVCFEFDATTNVLGYDKGAGGDPDCQSTPNTTAEGNQNEGKFIRVEDPDADNIHAFAGVVAAGGYVGRTGPRWVDVYEPNGAMVPVRTDLDCTVGRTVLSVESASQELTVPLAASTARPVAIAQETVDRSSASGLVLAILDPTLFLYQTGDGTSLLMDDDATAAETVNTMNLYFAGTGGPKRGLYAVGEIAGAGHSLYGMWKFRTYLNAAAASTVHGVCANLHIKDSGTLTRTSGTVNSALYVTVETEATTAPTLSGGDLCGISIEYYVDEATAGPANAYCLYCHAGTYNWDGLLWIRNAGDCGDSAMTGDHAFDSSDKCIPVLIGNYTGGTTYYIPLMNNKGD